MKNNKELKKMYKMLFSALTETRTGTYRCPILVILCQKLFDLLSKDVWFLHHSTAF